MRQQLTDANATFSRLFLPCYPVNPLECKSKYRAASNYMKLVHRPLVAELELFGFFPIDC